ncbi:MAG: phage virion morphogenesis protein [Bacteroides sp.]|nr:phage virion morphogenesis protein [Bacteroides sp.]
MNENITSGLEKKIQRFISLTLKDIRVELAEEFDRNFEREAFFCDKWKRRKWNDDESRGLLVSTGALRQSIQAEVVGQEKVVFSSALPYAKIHNEGGTITVTRKMKGYFWIKYREAMGQRSFKRDGAQRNDKKNRGINSAAEFYKAMALKKIGSKIIIPKRQFIGRHPDMERLLHEIAMANVKEVFNN